MKSQHTPLDRRHDYLTEDIKESHIRRGHEVADVTPYQCIYYEYLCSCGELINRVTVRSSNR